MDVSHNIRSAALAAVLVMTFVITSLALTERSSATVIDVAPAAQVSSLAQALTLAQSGDTLRIAPGTYVEHDLAIDKTLTLLGTDGAVIDAAGKGPILTITAAGVTIDGLEFRGTPVSFVKEHAAVLVSNTADCEIRDCRFVDNFFAIYLAKSRQCRLLRNTISGSAKNLTTAGNGIHLWYCHDVAIADNSITGHRDGIYLEFTKLGVITDNRSEVNFRYGLHFMFSDSCRYANNRFVRNGAGVAVMYTNRVEMVGNTFGESWGGASYGLLLKDIKDSRVYDNTFALNSVGIYMEGSDRVAIERNRFTANGWALKIMANCVGSEVVDNDFVDNSFQVTTNSRHSFSAFRGNYWSPYRGFDLDCDGFGDEPFRPVSLYSLLVESDPATLVLVRSLLVDVLNLAETIIPTLTPQTLIDATPRMRPLT